MTSKLPEFWHVSHDRNKHRDPENDETSTTQTEIRHRFIRQIEKLKEDYEIKLAKKVESEENPQEKRQNDGKDSTEKDLSDATYKCHVMQVTETLRELKDWYDWDVDYEIPDYKLVRNHIRKKHWWLYSPVTLNIITFLTLVLGIIELLVAIGYTAFPKTFIPGLRHKSSVSALFVAVLVFQGFFHIYCFWLGLGLRKIKSWEIGFVSPTWEFPFNSLAFVNVSLLVGIYIGIQDWRIIREMYRHLSLYNRHWFSRQHWDHYQSMMQCCGIEDHTDWFYRGPKFNALSDDLFHIPGSCCKIDGCTTPSLFGNTTGSNIYSSGCLKRTLISINFILSMGAICAFFNFILSVLAYLSVKEAKLYSHKGPLHYRDPLHQKLFQNVSVHVKNMDEREMLADVRLEKLLKLLNFYCYLIAKHIGLKKMIESIHFHHNVDTIKRFLNFVQKREDLWDNTDVQMAMEDIETFINNYESEKYELMQQSKLKDQEERFVKMDLVRNSGLKDDFSQISLNETSTKPTAKIVDLITGPTGIRVSPQEIAEVMHALRLDLNKQEEGHIVYRVAEKLSTIYETDESQSHADLEPDDSQIIEPDDIPATTKSANSVKTNNDFKFTHPSLVKSTPNIRAKPPPKSETENSEDNKPILKKNDQSKPPEKVSNVSPTPIPEIVQDLPPIPEIVQDLPPIPEITQNIPTIPEIVQDVPPTVPDETKGKTPEEEKIPDSPTNNTDDQAQQDNTEQEQQSQPSDEVKSLDPQTKPDNTDL